MRLKVGMIVRCIKPYDGNFDIVGKIGKVIYVYSHPDGCSVEFNERIKRGHNGNFYGKNGFCWNMPECCVIPFNQKHRIK